MLKINECLTLWDKIYTMKKLVFVFAALFLSLMIQAQAPKGKATPGTIYGAKVENSNAVEASTLPSLLSGKDTIRVKLQATVLDACAEKGCWMTLKINDSTSATVKMKGYAFFVPQDIIGKTVLVDGISFIRTTSVKELKHFAEDAKKSKKEIDAITEPQKQLRLLADGILVIK